MQVPSREALLSELDSLGYGARIARVATLGRDTQGTPELTRLMAEFLSGDAYEACLALELARGARDEATLLRGLTHPSCLVRGRAAAFAGDFIQDDAALERALPDLAPFVRRRILKGVALARRGALAARLLPSVHSRHGAAEAALLLPALDAEVVRQLLPRLGHEVHGWRTLVHRHPDVVLGFIQSDLAHTPEREREQRATTYLAALEELSLEHGEAVLALVWELLPPGALSRSVESTLLPRLMRNHPEQVAAFLARPAYRQRLNERGIPRSVLRRARAFSHAQRVALWRALADAIYHLGVFFEALPPSGRAAVYIEGGAPRIQYPLLVKALPHPFRDAEATRLLRLEVEQELSTLALRDIEHAREPLQKAALASNATARARALELLVDCTGGSRRGMGETLAFLARIKNEQDPVRADVMGALSRVPPSVFTSEHVPALETLVTAVLDARDTSRGTESMLRKLIFNLLRAHATSPGSPLFRFALDTLRKLAGRSEALEFPSLENLPHGTEHLILEALLPRIQAAEPRERNPLVIALAQALGRRAWKLDTLQTLLERITEEDTDTFALHAIQPWLAPPRTRDARVRKLLDLDESVINLDPVFHHLHRRRQEWLDPFLQGRKLPGRFLFGWTPWMPRVTHGFQRWLPRQQASFREQLLRSARDMERSTTQRLDDLWTLPRLQVTRVEDLTSFFHSEEVPVVEGALGALAWMDQPEQALPVLLESLDGDRARVAMYALPRVAHRMPPGRLSALLAGLLARERLKVTARKEAVRMLGTFRTPRSLALLRQQWDTPGVHRDVRIAVGHAARRLLDEEPAWELLESLARSPDVDEAVSLLSPRPATLPPSLRPRYAALLLEVARRPELHVRRKAFNLLPDWSGGAEELIARAAAGYVLELSLRAGWQEAVQALVQAVRDGRAFEHLVSCAAALLSAPVSETEDARSGRDVPARQRLKALCQSLLALPGPVRQRLRTRLDEVARVLNRDEALWPESAALRLAGLDWREADVPSTVLLALEEETREEPFLAPRLAAEVAAAVGPKDAEWRPEVLLEVADRVGPRLPLVAVALVSAAGQRLSWHESAARRLRALRQHPRAAVRTAAYATVTASE
ncbi:hypothetical protein [Cystobacter ferrugineus]|uniref:HEAT repeat domain-containing protein n=1 Tax=Cystobacter ferrugineus TaxID=83449 RepID=A0A1L9B8W1_9BACT|nr:hypothetical protein [Cystobacter ferrugineus]OJH38700.1 hypothetical protein BON30_20935 [Cystobacter ferrugineus]